MFFDERFNFLNTYSQWVQVSQYGDGASPLALVNVQAPKNGYAYVYVSNASAQPVYFDNFQVGLVHGPIIEEDHYYAYGLKIAGISSNIVPTTYEGYVTNKNLYNDKELVDDGGLDWYDYGYRSYDAQIGRFPQLDPLADDFPVLTPFQYASNEPIGNVDMDGLESLGSTGEGIADIGSTVGHWGALIDNSSEAAIDIDKIANAVKTTATTGSLVGRIGGLAVKVLQVSNTIAKTGAVAQVGAAAVDIDAPPSPPETGTMSVNESGQLVETGAAVGESGGVWETIVALGLRIGGTIGGVLIPLDAGHRKPEVLPPGTFWNGDGLSRIPKYNIKPAPQEKPILKPSRPEKPYSDDEPVYEQYVLRASKNGKYPVMKWGEAKPVDEIELKKGDVWKYGTTVNPDSRYPAWWLEEMHLRKYRQAKGSAIFVLAREGLQIIKYFIKHGRLPPGNKMFK